MLVVSLAGVVAGVQGAIPLMIASAVVAISFGCRAALRSSERCECVWDLLISGRGDVALAVLDRERRRANAEGFSIRAIATPWQAPTNRSGTSPALRAGCTVGQR